MQRKSNPIFPGVIQPAWLMHSRRERDIRIPRSMLIAIGLSVFVHLLLLIILVRQHLLDQEATQPVSGPLVVSIAKPPAPHIEAPPLPEPAHTPPPRVVEKPKPKVLAKPLPRTIAPPPITAKNQPKAPPLPVAPAQPTPPAQPAPKTPALDPSQFADMASYVKAMREQRGAGQEENKDEDLKQANLKQPKSGTNGVFQIPRMEMHTAILMFRGWKGEYSYSRSETFEVSAGAGEDIRLAVVRKMIEIIRRYYDGDFNWDSPSLGHVIVLSARLQDNDKLEAFLMKEFFIHGIQY